MTAASVPELTTTLETLAATGRISGTWAIPGLEAPGAVRLRGWRRAARAVENAAVAAALFLIMFIPLAEIVVRKIFGSSIPGAHAFAQHLTLVVGMLGGAVAAREGRLLTLATAGMFRSKRLRRAARLASTAVAVTITGFLMAAGIRFVGIEREGGAVLGYGVPTWIVTLVIPVGFALIAWRMVGNVTREWRLRLAVTLVAAVLAWIAWHPPVSTDQLAIPALGLLLAATVLGAPIFALLGGAALILFWAAEVPIAAVTVEHYRLSTNATLPAVPLFTLAGFLLAESGAPRRLIRLFEALVGRFRSGPAVLTALVCAFFTAFTGASGVTILALGGLLMPVLVAARYSERSALGLLTGAGSLGLLLPPSLPLILYAVIAQVDLTSMFLGGLLPGLLLVALTAAWAATRAPTRPPGEARQFNWREVGAAFWEAKWELLIPVVALGGLLSGLATPVEAAALTACYALVIETGVHRELRLMRDVPRVATECGHLVGGLLLILGVALGFTNYLVDAQIPTRGAEWVSETIHSPWLFLLLLNLFLIVVGAVMDIYSALVVVVPLIVPIGGAFGIDPIHLGIIFLANAELGYLMPPVGENLFIAALRFRKPVSEVLRSVTPMMLVFLVAVLLITYVPPLTTALPRWVGR